MDRQCGRQLYDRTCCAKQMWERLRRPMNTKQSRCTNPTLSCVELGVARPPPPRGHTLQVPGARVGPLTPQLQRARAQPESGRWFWRCHLPGTFQGALVVPGAALSSPHSFRPELHIVCSMCLRPSLDPPRSQSSLCYPCLGSPVPAVHSTYTCFISQRPTFPSFQLCTSATCGLFPLPVISTSLPCLSLRTKVLLMPSACAPLSCPAPGTAIRELERHQRTTAWKLGREEWHPKTCHALWAHL